jgi:hypothetical protein
MAEYGTKKSCQFVGVVEKVRFSGFSSARNGKQKMERKGSLEIY